MKKILFSILLIMGVSQADPGSCRLMFGDGFEKCKCIVVTEYLEKGVSNATNTKMAMMCKGKLFRSLTEHYYPQLDRNPSFESKYEFVNTCDWLSDVKKFSCKYEYESRTEYLSKTEKELREFYKDSHTEADLKYLFGK